MVIVAFVLELMRFEQNNPSVYSFSFHCSLLSGQPCRRRRELCAGHELVPSLRVGAAGSGSFVSRGAQFPQLVQDPPAETCRPCFLNT